MSVPEEFISEEMKNVSEVYQVQILLAYFLNQINQLCTPSQLLEIATGDGIVNYFVYVEAVSRMQSVGTLELTEVDGVQVYKLTEKGEKVAEAFKKQVPKSFRDKIYAAGLRLFARLKNERDVTFTIQKLERGYSVHCVCCDNGLKLMEITLFAPDEEQAEFIKAKIKMNPSEFYCNVLDYIIGNKEYEPDIS